VQRTPRPALLAAVALLALAPACTSKRRPAPGAGHPAAIVAVTDDFGARTVAAGRVAPGESAMTALRTVASVATADGGRFVSGIDGLAGNRSTRDWFFFVNGIQSDVGATDVTLHPGDRMWWDRRPYSPSHAMNVPAVIGSYPEPFVHGWGGRRPAHVQVSGSTTLARALQAAGAPVGSGPSPWRVLVGPAPALARDPAYRQARGGALVEVAARRVLVDDGRRLTPRPGATAGVWAAGGTSAGDGFTLVIAGIDGIAARRAADALARDPGLLSGSYAAAVDGQGHVVARSGRP
jgi:Domain of unknown function (DUF4430)